MRDAEVVIERPDVSRITVIVNIVPLKNGAGKITGVMNCFYDITERKRAEEGRAKLVAIVESSNDAILSKDLNGTIGSWNRGAEQLFGYTAQEAIGQSVRMLIPVGRADEEPRIMEGIHRGENVHYETVRRHKDGTLLDISMTVSPIKNGQGSIVGASKIARDITERKRSQKLLAAQKRVLELSASGAPLDEVLQLAVNSAREHSGEETRTSLFLLEPDGLHLRFVAAAGLAEGYIRAVDHFPVGQCSPSCGRVAFTAQPEIVSDLTLDPLWVPFLSTAQAHDIQAIWSQPMCTQSGQVLGTMALYHRTARQPKPGEMDAMILLSQTAALVIERNRELQQRQEAEDSLRTSEERYRSLFTSIDEGFCVI